VELGGVADDPLAHPPGERPGLEHGARALDEERDGRQVAPERPEALAGPALVDRPGVLVPLPFVARPLAGQDAAAATAVLGTGVSAGPAAAGTVAPVAALIRNVPPEVPSGGARAAKCPCCVAVTGAFMPAGSGVVLVATFSPFAGSTVTTFAPFSPAAGSPWPVREPPAIPRGEVHRTVKIPRARFEAWQSPGGYPVSWSCAQISHKTTSLFLCRTFASDIAIVGTSPVHPSGPAWRP